MMLMTQKYHSANDIDSEFIPSLEKLLCECIPSFDWIKNFEKEAPENTHFTYYLFFGSQHNAPVGFAQVALESQERQKRKLLTYILPFNLKSKGSIKKRSKKASWAMPGSLKEGVIFEPMYTKDAVIFTKKLFSEYQNREDIYTQSSCFSRAFSDVKDFSSKIHVSTCEKLIPSTLIKNQPNYEKYLASLDKDLEKSIKLAWRDFYKKEMKLGEYQSLKDIFSYKKESIEIYKKLKNEPILKKYKEQECRFLTLEKGDDVIAIIFFIKGFGHHYFFESLNLNGEASSLIITQLAIMKFYEVQDSDRLHLLGESRQSMQYEIQGFTTRSQIYLSSSQS